MGRPCASLPIWLCRRSVKKIRVIDREVIDKENTDTDDTTDTIGAIAPAESAEALGAPLIFVVVSAPSPLDPWVLWEIKLRIRVNDRGVVDKEITDTDDTTDTIDTIATADSAEAIGAPAVFVVSVPSPLDPWVRWVTRMG